MKKLLVFVAVLIFIVACKKEEHIIVITPEKNIHEKFNSAPNLPKYFGDVYQIDSIRVKYGSSPPWIVKSPDGFLTAITVLFQDSVLSHPHALWRNQVLGSGPLLVMSLSAYLDYTEIYYNGELIDNEDFFMMYVDEVRESNGVLFMKWHNYHDVWLEYNVKTKQWTYQPG